mgnify:CR=1 FL=1
MDGLAPQRLRAALALAPQAQLGVDADARIEHWSAAAAELLAPGRASLVGLDLFELFRGEDRASLERALLDARLSADGRAQCMVQRPRDAESGAPWLLVSVRSLPTELGGALLSINDQGAAGPAAGLNLDLTQALLQVAEVEFFSWERDTPFRCSPGYPALVGVGAESALSSDLEQWLQRVHPEDRAGLAARWLQSDEHASPIEYRISMPDGSWRWLRSAAFVRKDAEGRPVAIAGVARDVTAARESQQLLVSLRTLVETARVGIAMLDAEGRIELCNPSLGQAVGIDYRHMLGRTMREFCFAEDEPQLRARMREVMARGGLSFEWRLRRGDGRSHWFLVDATSYRADPAARAKFVFVATDIEAARQERMALVERHRWLNGALKAAGIAAFRQDRRSGEAEVLGSYAEIYGLPQARLLQGTELDERVHPDDLERLRAFRQDFFSTGKGSEIDYRLVLAGGRIRWVRVRVFPQRAGDDPCAVFAGTVQDITRDREQAEERERLQSTAHEAQKYESLALMASGVAHDLNNMLTGALGQLILLRNALVGQDEALRRLELSENMLGRMEGLTERMLAYAGKMAAPKTQIELGALLRADEPLLRAVAGPRIRLRLDLATTPLPLMASAPEIEQVLFNLVHNAVDAIGEAGGQIALRTGEMQRAEIRESLLAWPLGKGQRFAMLAVRDSGSGMDADALRRMFEPFFSTKAVGRGLGLAVVQGVLRDHGGSVRVLSRPDVGTEFRMYLPIAHSAQGLDAESATSAASPLCPLDVLLVDDDEDVLLVTEAILLQGGHRVHAYARPAEALAAFEGGELMVDIAVLDITMPVMDGPTLARCLRQRQPRLPVLYYSGYSQARVADLIGEDETVQFLRKPFTAVDLADAIARLPRPSD